MIELVFKCAMWSHWRLQFLQNLQNHLDKLHSPKKLIQLILNQVTGRFHLKQTYSRFYHFTIFPRLVSKIVPGKSSRLGIMWPNPLVQKLSLWFTQQGYELWKIWNTDIYGKDTKSYTMTVVFWTTQFNTHIPYKMNLIAMVAIHTKHLLKKDINYLINKKWNGQNKCLKHCTNVLTNNKQRWIHDNKTYISILVSRKNCSKRVWRLEGPVLVSVGGNIPCDVWFMCIGSVLFMNLERWIDCWGVSCLVVRIFSDNRCVSERTTTAGWKDWFTCTKGEHNW